MAELSVVFVDVRGFTALCERAHPTDVVSRFNRFYKFAAKRVFDVDGTLDKMVGDQVMTFFGAPFRPEDHAERTVRVSMEIVSASGIVAGTDSGDVDALAVGAGVATGEVFMGNVGEGEVRGFTVIGDTVNTASRLQGLASPGEVLVTEKTYAAVSSRFRDAEPRILELKGKEAPLVAYSMRVDEKSGESQDAIWVSSGR